MHGTSSGPFVKHRRWANEGFLARTVRKVKPLNQGHAAWCFFWFIKDISALKAGQFHNLGNGIVPSGIQFFRPLYLVWAKRLRRRFTDGKKDIISVLFWLSRNLI